MTERLGVLTTSRADYGLYRPLLRRLQDGPLQLCVLVGGAHLSPEHGLTVRQIESDGFPIAARVPCLPPSDDLSAQGVAVGESVAAWARELSHLSLRLLVALGDRYEMFAGVAAAYCTGTPVLHLYGGDVTEGALDDGFRHAMTKLSHLHAVSTAQAQAAVLQMGEEPWRVQRVGSLSVDSAQQCAVLSRSELAGRFGLPEQGHFLLATLHSTTLELEQADHQVAAFTDALEQFGMPCVLTAPNADPAGRRIRQRLVEWADQHPEHLFLETMGSEGYYSACRHAYAMVGNSSSGITEAVVFGLPVVNIGSRQQGRPRPANVIDVPFQVQPILAALRQAGTPEFRLRAQQAVSPYGGGDAAEKIAQLAERPWDRAQLLRKAFVPLKGFA